MRTAKPSPTALARVSQATIAVVRYESLGLPRIGVCSTYAAERVQSGACVPVYIHKNPDFRCAVDGAPCYDALGDVLGALHDSDGTLLGLSLSILSPATCGCRLPADATAPIIMVGPGTGLAPFRAFIQQRVLEAECSGAEPGEMVLYFGCRRSDQVSRGGAPGLHLHPNSNLRSRAYGRRSAPFQRGEGCSPSHPGLGSQRTR